MVQELESKPNMFGRFGQGISKGIADVVPKEIERYRLSEGLKQFEKEAPNLSIMQQYARLAAIPGISPQAVKTFGELAQKQNLRQIYGQGTEGRNGEENPRGRRGIPASALPEKDSGRQQLQGINFLNLPQRGPQVKETPPPVSKEARGEPETNLPSNYPSAEREAKARPSNIINPLSESLQPIPPWTTEEKEEYKGFLLRRNPNMTEAEADQQAADAEARERAQPEAGQEIEDKKKAVRKELDTEFDTQLKKVLQKEGNEVYKDLTGETLLNLQNRAYDDLSTDPELNAKSAAEKWVKKGKQLVETKSLLKGLAHRDMADKSWPAKKEETLKKLMSGQKIYAETGNKNEFYDMLRSKNGDGQFGFDLSPGGAALIAYDRSEPVKKMIKSNENWHKYAGGVHEQKLPDYSRKFAKDVWEKMNDDDSILAIAREMKQNNRFFDAAAFFDYFRENQDKRGLTPHQKQELVSGVGDIFPNWGDLAVFPYWGRSVAND